MKILMIEPYVDIDRSLGDSTHVKELAVNLSRLGNHVILIARSSKNEFFNVHNLEFKNVNLTRTLSTGIGIGKILSVVYTFFVGFTVLLISRVDIIHERHPFAVGLVLGKIFGVPTVTEVNGSVIDELDYPEFNRRIKLSSSIIKKIYSILEKAIFSSTNKIVTVTFNLKEMINKVYHVTNEKISVIHNGVNIDLFRPISYAKEHLKLDANSKYLCFVGHLMSPESGVEYLVESAPFILEKVPETKFLIVGHGIMKENLVTRVRQLGLEDKFHFTGKIAYKNVPLYINAADVCVAPFVRKRNEKIGLSPIKLYEYLACGKPVVASNIKGVGDLLTKSNSGIPIPPENSFEVAKAIVNLLKDEKLAREMGENGRRLVVKDYSWESVARKLIHFMSK